MKTIFILTSAILFLALSINSNSLSYAGNKDSVKTCIVSGQDLGDDKVELIYLNETIELCCDVCVKAFNKEPAKYLTGNLWCPVCDDDDGNKEISAVHNNVKYYFCNNGCKETFENTPEEVLSKYNKDEK